MVLTASILEHDNKYYKSTIHVLENNTPDAILIRVHNLFSGRRLQTVTQDFLDSLVPVL